MSREIKFRAWDKEKKEMLYKGDEYNGQAAGGDYYYSSHWDFIAMGIAGAAKEDGLHLMQYTGLKDKNGVEIYDSDLVKTPAGAGVVEWKDGCYWLVWPRGGKTTLHDIRLSHREVIGNIYESPELLEPAPTKEKS